jgi:photosystem II stability/assembly factor-like uncharacterized protein
MKKLQTLLLLTVLLISENIFSQTWTSHNAGTSYVFDLSFPTNDSGYVLSGTGQIRKTFNGANSWSTISPPPMYVSSLFFVSGKEGCVGGDSSVYRTINAGATWTETLHDNKVYFYCIYFADGLTGFASGIKFTGDSTRLYKTINGGNTWSKISTMLTGPGEQAFYFFNPTMGFWANAGSIFSTANGGTTFNSVYYDISQANIFENIYFPNADTGYAVGDYDSFIKSLDGGATWSSVTFPGAATYDTYFINGRKGFACGGDGFSAGWVQETSDEGASWTPSYTSPYSFYCMDFPSDTVGYVGGDNGTVLKYSVAPTAITENKNASAITVFPNPSNGNFQLKGNFPMNSQLHIYDLLGNEVANPISLPIGEQTIPMNPSLAEGIYFYRVVSNKEILHEEKLVIVK